MCVYPSWFLQVAIQLKNGQFSATELCEKCLKRVEHLKAFNAFVVVTEKLARKAAEASERRHNNGNYTSCKHIRSSNKKKRSDHIRILSSRYIFKYLVYIIDISVWI